MLKNYFIVAWRNLLRSRTISLINIFGLAIGLLVCAFIYQYVHFELSYDKFQVNGDRLYRVALENTISDKPSASATNHPAVGPAMVAGPANVQQVGATHGLTPKKLHPQISRPS